MIKSLVTEYGLLWFFNRSLYSTKLKMMKAIPKTEFLFEKEVNIKQIDIINVDTINIEEFLDNLPDIDKKEIIKLADNAIEGKIKGFSSLDLDYGSPIDWHYNPITGVKVDKGAKWYKIPDFDPNMGDIKAIWEASRFTHFFYLTRAYILTKNKKYYDAYSNQLEDWLKENPYSYGANYKCGQEATLRMINALIAYSVFNHYGLIESNDEVNLKALVKGSYKKVLSNFFYAHKCIKNNHTLSEITGLIVGAWCIGDKIAMEKAYKLLDKEIEKQFLEDGGYVQFSFNYQRFALQIMEFVLKISNKTGIYPSIDSLNLIKKSVLQMYQLQDETGDVPNYGSNDGALIFPVTVCDYRDFRPVLNTVYTIIEGKRLYEHDNYDEEILWFSDKKLDDIPVCGIEKETTEFKNSGLYSLRYKGGFLMIILQDFKTRPAQMDQMHIDLWYKGVNILCDSGTYSYATDIGEKMALTSAHNTAKIDNKEQMKKHGPFFIYDWTKSKDLEFDVDRFKGTMISKNGYSHTREIVKGDKEFILTDKVSSQFENFVILFHTPCDIEEKEYGLNLYYNKSLIAKLLIEDKFQIEEGYRSLYYLQYEYINQISINSKDKNSIVTKIVLID